MLAVFCGRLAAEAAVNGLEEVGHSYQADMRGGTEVAVGDTALSQIRQPASPALHKVGRLDSKLTIIYPISQFHGPLDSSTSGKPLPPNFSIGYVTPLKERLSMGLAIYSKMSGSSRFANQFLTIPNRKTVTSAGLSNYAVATTFACRVNEKLLLGVAPRVELLTIKADMVRDGSQIAFPRSWSVGAGYTLGVLYLPTEKLFLGASYRSATWMTPLATQKGRLLSSGLTGIAGPLRVRGFVVPRRVSCGASYIVNEKIRLSSEAGFINYRNSLLGNSTLAGILNTGIPVGYKDVWIVNGGADYEINKNWGISAGYSFNTSPMRANRVIPQFASTNQNSITYGLRFKKGRVWGGAAHIVGLPSSVRNVNASPLPGTPSLRNARVNEVVQSLTVGIGFNI